MDNHSTEEWLGKALKDAYPCEEWMLDGLLSAVLLLKDRTEVREMISGFLGQSSTIASIVDEYYRRKDEQVALGDTRSTPISMISSMSLACIQHDDRASQNKDPEALGESGTCINSLHAYDLNRTVVNCLSCGKIFDLRRQERFVGKEAQTPPCTRGVCTFCGAHIMPVFCPKENTRGDAEPGASILKRSSHPATMCFTRKARSFHTLESSVDDASTGIRALVNNQHDHVCDVPIPAAVTLAMEAKDRLVDFDRSAASRTDVIDDQIDWFEIDGNVWLEESERIEVKNQVQDMFVAQKDRRARHVAIDLLGRKVGESSFGQLITKKVNGFLLF